MYGYTVTCSCGWEKQTNENKRETALWFREHIREMKAIVAEAAAPKLEPVR